MEFTVICAWCGRVEKEGHPDAPVSHTICIKCSIEHFPDVVQQTEPALP